MPDDVLTRALEQGDREAFGAVCGAARPGLAATCAAIVGHDAAEDVVQDVLLKIWLNRSRFDASRSSFAAWASTIARHTAIDHARRATLRATATRELEQARPAVERGHDDRMIAAEVRRTVRAAAASLPLEQRRAIFGAFWLDRSHSEAADDLRIPLGTVKGRIRGGLSRMRLSLDEGYGPAEVAAA